MNSVQLLIALISAGLGSLTTLVTVLYGPLWKDRLDHRRQRELRAQFLLSHYSEPLARAAFDLHSRIYNLIEGRVLERYRDDKPRTAYLELSTLWLFGQYLGWVEIFRREVQLLEMGDTSRTAKLQQYLFDVSAALSADRGHPDYEGPLFMVWRADQRAIGEQMVVDRTVRGESRSDCMGYAQFVRSIQDDERFALWFAKLREDICRLRDGEGGTNRLIRLQHALLDIVTFLDSRSVWLTERRDRLAARLAG